MVFCGLRKDPVTTPLTALSHRNILLTCKKEM